MTEPFVDAATRRPPAVLRGLVDGYHGYDMRGFEPGTHQGLPSRHLTFIVSLDGPVELVRAPGARQAPGAFDAFLSGLHDEPATIAHDGNQRGVAIELTPAGARALFGLPAGALAFQVVELDAVAGSPARELVERLHEAGTWAERFAAVDDVLLRLLDDRPPPPPEVARAWHVIQATGGNVAVADLAADVGWSRRHLAERFRTELGLAPKAAARVVRFERARRLVERADRPPLAEVAARCGYYDQAHLNRDFRELAGASPLEWLAAELPSVQDAAVEVPG